LSSLAEPRLAVAGPVAELIRIWAFAARNLTMARRNVFFVFELTFWPGVALLSHGLLTRFLELTPEMTAFILVGTVALSTVQICQLDVAYAVLFDIWSKSMKHQFLAPVGIRHLAVGSWLVGVGRGLVCFGLMAALGRWAFGFDFVGAGPASLAVFLAGCFLCALVIGLLVCTLVVVFGTRAETAAWASVNFFVMLSGIYYPVSVLPDWAQVVAAGIPLTYFLDVFRAGYGFPLEFEHALTTGFGLALAYVVLAHWALAAAVRRARRTGLLLKLSE
jgi:ABC-2 type transport system permease protein